MPGGDRTGPMGFGPMTGRGLGYCAGYAMPGYANPAGAWGSGFGRGRGRGWRFRYWATGIPGRAWRWPAYAAPQPMQPGVAASVPSEVEMLRQQAEYLKESLDAITERLKALEADKEEGEAT